MATRPSVLVVGLEPSLIDFSSPDYAHFPGLTAEKVRASLDADEARLKNLGYDAQQCLVDFGATAEDVLSVRLREKPFDCVVIGAGVRTVASNFLLFEKLLNVVHRLAQQARICFNTKPDDTAAAVQRWLPVPTA